MIHSVAKPKSLQEHNFFHIIDQQALGYSVERLGQWYRRVEIDADELRKDQALGVGGTLLQAYEAKSADQLKTLVDQSEILAGLVQEQDHGIAPTAQGPTQLAIYALESLLYRSEIDLENRALAAMYQHHLHANPQPIQTLVELDRVLPLLLTLGIRCSKNVRALMPLKKLVEPIAAKIK
jgi:hypothetical protein